MKRNWKRRYSAYLFDLDGTLVDTAPDIDAALNFSLKRAGLNAVTEDLTRHWVSHGSKIWKLLITKVHKGKLSLCQDFIATKTILPTTASLIHKLRALATLKDGGQISRGHQQAHEPYNPSATRTKSQRYFSSVVCGDSTKFPKPSPEPVLLAMPSGSNAAESLFVGDSETDVSAARNANMLVVCMKMATITE